MTERPRRRRCNHHATCGATADQLASNWCEHWALHNPSDMEDACGGICYGHRDREGKSVQVSCEPRKDTQ